MFFNKYIYCNLKNILRCFQNNPTTEKSIFMHGSKKVYIFNNTIKRQNLFVLEY